MKHQKLETDSETSKRMSNIKLKKGSSEVALGKELWHRGIRYEYNYKKLPGSPDITIKKYKIAVFIDGEFWHGKDWKSRKTRLKSNTTYWISKIEENISRDKKNDQLLKELGWTVLHFWDKEVKKI